MKIGKVFSGLDVSALGMRAQRRKMDAIAENIANVETTRTEHGGPYRRKIVQFKDAPLSPVHGQFAHIGACAGQNPLRISQSG